MSPTSPRDSYSSLFGKGLTAGRRATNLDGPTYTGPTSSRKKGTLESKWESQNPKSLNPTTPSFTPTTTTTSSPKKGMWQAEQDWRNSKSLDPAAPSFTPTFSYTPKSSSSTTDTSTWLSSTRRPSQDMPWLGYESRAARASQFSYTPNMTSSSSPTTTSGTTPLSKSPEPYPLFLPDKVWGSASASKSSSDTDWPSLYMGKFSTRSKSPSRGTR